MIAKINVEFHSTSGILLYYNIMTVAIYNKINFKKHRF